MVGDPVVHIGELLLTQATAAWNIVTLRLLSSRRILKVNSLQVVLVGVATGKDTQGVATVVL